MKSFGSLLMILGVGSFVLNMIGYEFSLLMWIDNWGETVGWVIRGAMVVVGAGLFFFSPSEDQAEEADAAE
ncbi:MAG: hypothetical protein OEY16_08180 [Alphaproteobacteria bacterium]|nr:hypothetical protein [Alphaproteobacteria bacterium]